jgi:hypothetical protein
MALKLIASYSKRLGLPGYSSHQFSVCIEAELASIHDVAEESARLYQTLQQSVHDEIQHTGFVPQESYGQANGNHSSSGNGDHWNCSAKQQELILKLVNEHSLEKGAIEALSKEMFGAGVRELNKLQASGLIDRIIEEHGGKQRSRSTPPRRNYQRGGSR